MKIACFCSEFPPLRERSLGVYAREMSRKFLEVGHEVTVFTTNPDGSFLSSEMWKGIDYIGLKIRLFVHQGSKSYE